MHCHFSENFGKFFPKPVHEILSLDSKTSGEFPLNKENCKKNEEESVALNGLCALEDSVVNNSAGHTDSRGKLPWNIIGVFSLFDIKNSKLLFPLY